MVCATAEIRLDNLATIRADVVTAAQECGVSRTRAENFAVAVNEAAINTIRYAGGTGTITTRTDDSTLIAEVTDHGSGFVPALDSRIPDAGSLHGRGLWMARGLCDRLDIRSTLTGTHVRLSVSA